LIRQVRSSYRQIFKATSLFGGVQVFNILITIVRGKFTAILIGTTGMGINGLLMSAIMMIKNLTSLGLPESAVKDIAAAKGAGDYHRIAVVVSVFKRWIWFTALLGILVTLVLAHYLSIWVFGDTEYTFSFMLLSVVLVFGAFTGSTYTLLRGLRMLKYLALANVLGTLGGLFIALPFYYFYGLQGIVPAIIGSAVITWLISLYFKSKINIPVIPLASKAVFAKGVGMVQLGVVLSFNAFLIVAVRFALNAYISRFGSLADIGLYNAGITITAGYVGLVFTAMATDYFPRLSAAIEEPAKWRQIVLHQAELVLLTLAPILVLLVLTAPWVIKLLLTSEFLPTLDYIYWAVIGLFFQAIVWALGFIIVAKGDLKVKLITEIFGHTVRLVTGIIGYAYGGIEGLGIAFLISNMVGLVLNILISHFKYAFHFSSDFLVMSVILIFACFLALSSIKFIDQTLSFTTGAIAFIAVSSYSYYQLNKRLDFAGALKKLTNRRKY
jgi:O-antigen/teichoic acid export membrane protein